MRLFYASVLDLSTIDYPGKIAAVVFTCGCSFRCGFCQNGPIVLGKGCREEEVSRVFDRIKAVAGPIDAVVLTGGEPLTQPEPLLELCQKIKKRGLLMKLDTNGYHPEALEKLLPCIDYVAMDIKSALNEIDYSQVACVKVDMAKIRKSIGLLAKSKAFVEARTTIIPGMNDTPKAVESMAKAASEFADVYVLQQFLAGDSTLDPAYSHMENMDMKKLRPLAQLASKYIKTKLRSAAGEEEIREV